MSVPALPNTSRLGVCWRSGLAGQGVHQLEQRATFRTQYIPIVAAGRPCCRTEIELEQTAVGEDRGMRCLVIGFLLALPLSAARLTPETMAAFERYIRQTEQRLDERKPFLWADESPDRARLVRQGQVVVEPVGPSPTTPVPDGLVHDWVGAVCIPGATLERTLAVMEDYNHKEAYRPEIMESRILSGDGHDFRVYMRLLKKKVITVVLDSGHDIHYYPVDKTRWRARSRTTRVQEVDHAGKSNESLKPPRHRAKPPVASVHVLADRGARRRHVGGMRSGLADSRRPHRARMADQPDYPGPAQGKSGEQFAADP